MLLHMIGNAHLDPAWMWRWPEGVEAFVATVRSALERMRETPGFVFTCSSAVHYRWIEELEPGMFEEIRARVEEGRWAIVGGWWLQADCNLPSGEGLMRQGLLAQRYFLEKFGVAARTGYSPDAFGHSLGLPQILRESGMEHYIFCRPDPAELTLPSPLFRWAGPDGRSVIAYRVPLHYNMYETSVPKKVDNIIGAFNHPSELTGGVPLSMYGDTWCLFYGVGNHGGGPTREHIEQIIEIDADPRMPELRFSHPDAFFDAIHADGSTPLPVWTDDLQMNSPGCYSAHSLIKKLNRECEHQLAAAETYCTLAAVTAGRSYPLAPLRAAWQDVCFNHFHDIICGVAIREALDDAIGMYGRALTAAREATATSLHSIARRIDTTGAGQTLIAFNPHSWELRTPARFELWHDIDKSLWDRPVDVRVTDDHGAELPCQTGFTSGKIGRDRIAVTFDAVIPPLGWRCYRVHYGQKSHAVGGRTVTDTTIENGSIRLEISPGTGAIVSLRNRHTGEEIFPAEAAVPVAIEDRTDTWGHGVERFDREIGRFAGAEVRVVADGPVHTTIRARSFWRGSYVQQDFTVYGDSPLVHVDVKIFWAEHYTMLKLDFPTTITRASALYESAYCVTEKPCDGRERPGHRWASLVGERHGAFAAFAIANDAKYGYSATTADDGSSALQITLLRSPGYATHDPHPFDVDEDLDFLDQGVQRFSYVIVPTSGIDRAGHLAEITRIAATLNVPAELRLESPHPSPSTGQLDRTHTGIRISPANIIATALKRSEDDDAWILRLYECSGHATDAHVELPLLGAMFSPRFNPHEVQTWRIADGMAERARETEAGTWGSREDGKTGG